MKKFVVRDGVIENIIEADDSFLVEGCTLHPADGVFGNIGWAFENGAPVEPPDTTTIEEAWAALRMKRDGLLSSSDWTQVADAPVDQAVWAVYRQELRDLPANTTDPYNPIWPTPPA